MSVRIQVCTNCGHRYFPSRYRCQQCGRTHFETLDLYKAQVQGVTEVHRPQSSSGWRWLVQLAAEPDVTLLAVSKTGPHVGETMDIDQMEDGSVRVWSGKSGI